MDESGGVLPGVTVAAISDDGRTLATAVTDQVGRYAIDSLPQGAVRLTFQLEGFSNAAGEATVGSGRDTAVAPQRLLLAARSESVTVEGKTPVVVAVVPPYRPPLPNPPPPVVMPVPAHDRDSICGPAKPDAVTDLSERSGRAAVWRERNCTCGTMSCVIDGGTADHLTVGQNVVARRTFRVPGDPRSASASIPPGSSKLCPRPSTHRSVS